MSRSRPAASRCSPPLFAVRQRIEQDDGFLAQTFFAIQARLTGRDQGAGEPPRPGDPDLRDHWFYGPAARRFGSGVTEGPLAVWRIISVFLMISVFWALFDQHASTWVAQAQTMDRQLDFGLGGWLGIGAAMGAFIGLAALLSVRAAERRVVAFVVGMAVGLGLGYAGYAFGPSFEVQPSQVPATNPFMVMLLIPLTTFGLYPLMDRLGISPHPLRRISMGMGVGALAFVSVALLQARIDAVPAE